MNRKQLEEAAARAHEAGQRWGDFWKEYGPSCIAAEPYSTQRFRRLRDRLLHLVCCGDESGEQPVDGELEPWEQDDQAVDDTRTRARLQPDAFGSFPG